MAHSTNYGLAGLCPPLGAPAVSAGFERDEATSRSTFARYDIVDDADVAKLCYSDVGLGSMCAPPCFGE